MGVLFFSASSAQSIIADSCGTPTPATTLVVQLAPAPIPILGQSTPTSIKDFTPSTVATFPAMRAIEPVFVFNFSINFNTPEE